MDSLNRVFARNCVVRRIDKACAAEFLSLHHRLGATGGRYRYALFVSRTTGSQELPLEEGTMVAVAVFSNARRWTKGERKISSYEWIRYACLEGVTIVGGMSKLLSSFIEEVKPDDIMSYASAEDGGEVYRKLGFAQESLVERDGFRNIKYRLKLTEW